MKMFNLPNILTGGNLLCGILAICLVLNNFINAATYCILIAAVLDFFDGFLARLLKQQSELGKQLDSLADVVSFGVAPGVFIFVFFIHYTVGHTSGNVFVIWWNSLSFSSYISFLPFIGFIIPFFSLFRLAKFNLDTRQSNGFIGLPTPANTLFFVSFFFLASSDKKLVWQEAIIDFVFNPLVLIFLVVVFSFLLIAEIPLFAMKFKDFKWKGNEVRFTFLTTCGLLLAILQWWALPFIVLLYVIFSLVNNLLTKNKQNEI